MSIVEKPSGDLAEDTIEEFKDVRFFLFFAAVSLSTRRIVPISGTMWKEDQKLTMLFVACCGL